VTELVPVSQWVYDLYKVSYWTDDPAQGGKLIKTVHIASASENHLRGDADREAPRDECWMSWEVVKENVGHPRVIGSMYGQPLHETGIAHGRRLAEKM
jgi:hypothetical protein